MTKLSKPIAMKFTLSQYEAIKPILIENKFSVPEVTNYWCNPYLVNNYCGNNQEVCNVGPSALSDWGRDIFEEWDQDVFLAYCGIEINKNMGYKFTVPVTDVLRIHNVACDGWKTKIKKYYLNRMDSEQNITFNESEIDDMFGAATIIQTAVLTQIFGEKKKLIDYDKLKTGSKVMIKRTGEHCGGFASISADLPVDIVFYKTPHYINGSGKFDTNGAYESYITFHQNGSFVLFSSRDNIDCIISVVEY